VLWVVVFVGLCCLWFWVVLFFVLGVWVEFVVGFGYLGVVVLWGWFVVGEKGRGGWGGGDETRGYRVVLFGFWVSVNFWCCVGVLVSVFVSSSD